MSNIYEILKEYLELEINNLKKDKSKEVLRLYETVNLFLNTPRNKLNNLDNSIHQIICTEILKNDQSLLNKYRLLCAYSSFIDNSFLNNDPQIIDARNNYKELLERLTNFFKMLEIQVYKLKRKNEESKAIISVYENYLSLFNKDGIIKHLEKDELNSFFQFLRKSSLDKEVVLGLITEFAKFNIEYQINRKKLKTSSRIREIETRANIITEEISASIPSAPPLEAPKEIVPENLTEEEQKILNKIKIIISELNGVIGDNSLLELLDGEFSLDGRKEIYEAAGRDKWKLIYDDVVQNLLPNLEINKDKVLAIFEYIINTYTGRNKEKVQQNLDIQYEDIIVIENVRINKYLELSRKSRFTYESYSEDQQKLIDITYKYLQEGDEVGLNSLRLDVPLTDIVFMKNLDKLKSLLKDWEVLRELSNDEILSYGIQEYKETLKETSDSIVSILDNLDKDYEKIQSKVMTPDPEEIIMNSDNSENYVIFLNDENGVPIVLDTVKNMTTTENLMDVCRSINNMNNVNYFEFMKNYTTSAVNPIREPQMYKVRRNESRIAFIQVPISSENRNKIGKEFNNSKKFNLVLVVNFGFKHTDSKKQNVYDEFNRIYDININQIMQIFNLFSTNFDEKSFEEAKNKLLDGIETVKQIEKIAKDRGKKGV